MRIIAGQLGGRVFDSPRGHRTHPMSDRMRGGLFNTLGDIEDLTILDAFAGSGALSFEAISRGANHATAVDIDKNAATTIADNAIALGVADRVKAIRAGVASWLETTQDNHYFDIITADPPYDDLQDMVLQKLVSRLNPTGIFVLSWPGKAEAPLFDNLELVQQNNYGDGQLLFYKAI
ncbi:MAG TPA: RsmD family RNA methyltransferase [Candidatus Saccharimonadales bacterium]|nr:RsmD family RNA methyltransferase [Candidatus Saccharimonadales bacterium]